MISESVASLFSVCEIAIISATGAMIRTSAGITRLVSPRNVTMVWPWLVIRSMPRNACVIQITPVRLTRTSANDASVVRKMYLSIDPIVPVRSRPATAEQRIATKPLEEGVPIGYAAPVRSAYLLTYHPFDPSTKWPPRGAVKRWLIFPVLWRRGHVAAWHQRGLQAIVRRWRASPGHDGPWKDLCGPMFLGVTP